MQLALFSFLGFISIFYFVDVWALLEDCPNWFTTLFQSSAHTISVLSVVLFCQHMLRVFANTQAIKEQLLSFLGPLHRHRNKGSSTLRIYLKLALCSTFLAPYMNLVSTSKQCRDCLRCRLEWHLIEQVLCLVHSSSPPE